MVNRRNNRRRARRAPRRNRRNNNNLRNIRLYRKPPNPGSIPRNTGLSAGGLTTTVAFEIPIIGTASNLNQSGWATVTVDPKSVALTFNYMFSQRTDGVRGLLALYSEFRLNRLNAYWVPSLGWASNGQFAFAVVDAGYGLPPANSATFTYADVAVAPNSTQVHVGQRTGRSWVPTEPTSIDWRGPSSVACNILYAATGVFAPVGVFTDKDIGKLLVKANLSLRSPITTTYLSERLLQTMELQE